MEDCSSQSIFESLNLSPQLFTNEILNVVDDKLDQAFQFFLQEASARLKTEGTDRSDELAKGVSYIRELVQSTLDKRMQMWEEYCLRFCFSVPEGFHLPKANDSHGDGSVDLDTPTNTELDAQLNSLRARISLAGKESAEIARELHDLERQSLSNNQSAGSIDEMLQLYEEGDATRMFQELTNMASEFSTKLGNLKRKRTEEVQRDRADWLNAKHDDVLRIPHGNGLFGAKLEELKELVDVITMW
ncbi:hypothetical protein C2S51_026007 [Perilla frutescens var. frutescens]|nr:hypothetical protein C2S51_026007 [Perilla frutescens var. frutescens]